MNPIDNFIARCDAYCKAHDRSRVWLSKQLFQDTYRLGDLAAGRTDVGVNRLAKADEALTALEVAGDRTGSQVAA